MTDTPAGPGPRHPATPHRPEDGNRPEDPRHPPARPRQRIPVWRDVRVLRAAGQVAFAAALVAAGALLYANLSRNLRQLGVPVGFDFLALEAGFAMGEPPIPYRPSDTYARAFAAGVINTLRVSGLGILLATVLGVAAGVGRLSSNWLVRQITGAYVEMVRNTPLLLQLFVWAFAVFGRLPPPGQAIHLGAGIYFSNRGVFLPWPAPAAGFAVWAAGGLAGLAGAVIAYRRLLRVRLETGRRTYPGLAAAAVLAAGLAAGWTLAPAPPFTVSVPTLAGFNFRGGASLTVQFSALTAGLAFYTGAFIAEVVRGGIQSVPRGQTEAAAALGLRPSLIMRLVILPQALRVIVPPLTNQYLNVIKNSSLAVAVGFEDAFFVARTVFNQTGRTFETVAIVMATYLAFSLLTSLLMNLYNRSVQLVER